MLVKSIIAGATEIGYEKMRLDIAPPYFNSSVPGNPSHAVTRGIHLGTFRL
jgi:hypothetical protein